jgi:hypothetical protein
VNKSRKLVNLRLHFYGGLMSVVELIEQFKALPIKDRAEVAGYIIHQEVSWIPQDLQEAMIDVAQGDLVTMDKVFSDIDPSA